METVVLLYVLACELFFIHSLFYSLLIYKSPKHARMHWVGLGALAILLFLFNYFSLQFNVKFLLITVLLLIYSLLFYKKNIFVMLYCALLFALHVLAGDCFALGLTMLAYPEYSGMEALSQPLPGMLSNCFYGLYFIISGVVIRCFAVRSVALPRRLGALLVCVPAASIVVMFATTENLIRIEQANALSFLIPSITFLLINIYVLLFYRTVLKNEAEKTQSAVVASQLQFYETMIQSTLPEQEAYKTLRHDMKHHIDIMEELLERNETGQLERYLTDLRQTFSSTAARHLTKREIFTHVVRQKALAAQEAGIEFHDDILLPDDINVFGPDVCIILGNLLDNALEAAAKVGPDERRYINASISVKQSYLFIKIENSFAQPPLEINGVLQSSKEDSGAHGIGLQSVKQLAEKYDGHIETKWGDHVFTCRCVLQLSLEGILTA